MRFFSIAFMISTLSFAFVGSFPQRSAAGEREPLITIDHGKLRPSRDVTSVCFSPDEKTIASAGGGQVRLWGASSGKEMQSIKADGAIVVFSPDGKTLACGGSDYRVTLWNVVNGKASGTLQDLDAGEVLSLSFRADGKRLATGHHVWTGRVWDIEKAKAQTVLKGDTSALKSVSFSPDGKTVAGGSHDGTRVWDAETGKEKLFLRGGVGGVNAVCFHPDGKVIASGGEDWKVTLWNSSDGKQLRTIGDARSGAIFALCFSPDGKTIASAGSPIHKAKNAVITVWDVDTGKARVTMTGDELAIHSIQFSPSGKLIAAGGSDGKVRIWSVATDK
jgi:WD40 repeat protein